MTEAEHLEAFRSNLNLIRSLSGEKADEEFYNLMEKAKQTFGDLNLLMGQFYFQYAKFILEKMEKNNELFNAEGLPPVQDRSRVSQAEAIEERQEGEESSSQSAPQQEDQPVISEDKAEGNCEENKVGEGENKVGEGENKVGEGENKVSEGENKVSEGEKSNQEGQDDDFEVCASNLLCAIQIYEEQRDRIEQGGAVGQMEPKEVQRFISRCRSRLGDLYHLNENYQEAVEAYRRVIADEEKKEGHQSNRGLAEIHYMVANSFLYENKDGCEEAALQEFFSSISILLNKLKELNPDDSTQYEAPCLNKVKVDRFAYLPKPNECDETKDIKEVISCLLDKIEDTFEQIGIRKQYQEEIQKLKEKAVDTTFKAVSAQTPVTKLGTFGNRRKKIDIDSFVDQDQSQKSDQKANHKKEDEHKQ